TGRYAKLTASVSNFVPKAHTPYQWNGMAPRDYFRWAHDYLHRRKRLRSVTVKCHDTEASLVEGALSRADRRLAAAIELAWRRGWRMDSWCEEFSAARWWDAIRDAGLDAEQLVHRPCELGDRLPWDHVNVKKGRAYLEKEQTRAVAQLAAMADAR